MMVAETPLDKGAVPFQAEGRLLQELGERLVASPDVALVELVKNAFDADSPSCDIRFYDEQNSLVVRDSGNGMTLDGFLARWMRIATSHKVEERESPKYRRPMTGQKGIGRFAVRFLGHYLRLDTIAWDQKRGCKTRLVAEFNWRKLDKAKDIGTTRIPFTLTKVSGNESTGTTLSIQGLRWNRDFVTGSPFRTAVLKLISPLQGLEQGRFDWQKGHSRGNTDPGFFVTLPGDAAPSDDSVNLANQVLGHYWAKLTIDLTGDRLAYRIYFGGGSNPSTGKFRMKTAISKGLFADIRFFPRRAGLFQDTGVDGRRAWTWVRDNHGVSVVDHGFRIKPYGDGNDDWLSLDRDAAHNERDWRSSIAKKFFPIPEEVRAKPGENPMLNLPSNFQLVGAVFVESAPTSDDSQEDLTPSMDREGFLDNSAFKDLVCVVRGGLEFLAQEDKKRIQKEAERRANLAKREIRADFRAAVEYIEGSPTLTEPDKKRLIEDYSGLAKQLEEVEEYNREARRRLEIMSLLGVVSGFLTHEAARIMASLEEAITEVRKIASSHHPLKRSLIVLEQSYASFSAHVDYTKVFTDAVQEGVSGPFKSAAQVKYVMERFGAFAEERRIAVECDIEDNIEVPAMPVAIYSGVLLNLYTNALKAIVASKSSEKEPRIVFRAWNDPKWHTVEVLDTGIGIPPKMRARVWDPLFTTTSRLNNPLGSGMGLGLSLVKQLVGQMGGKIDIVDAPPDFSTCFRVVFPRRKKR